MQNNEIYVNNALKKGKRRDANFDLLFGPRVHSQALAEQSMGEDKDK